MARPDFGKHYVEHESGGYKTTLSCDYQAPGLTFTDLMKIFEAAEAERPQNGSLSGNPYNWPNHRGVWAVKEAIMNAIYPPEPSVS